ncbi:KxYKxGKxW signal peptide domain-containing protein [Lactococcus cremoris]|uniref:KxYKxGKxW signal peptide domain-containing protein n=1 Tax=Lactococcus lactis subsp. cremoris TaxID=1359 RepID=UPI002871E22F|nr:KxYKxGKxW signal peptide domain-containing protein [Lactococcus cremoris]MDR9867438.1 KxYKxGKxW signal peptide domain-containing protein [Lactococcus cremoris]
MYYSKHQKGYKTSHKVQVTHFRTWKSGEKWVYAFMAFSLLAGDIGSIPLLQHGQEQIVHAATSSSGTLVPNSPASTNNNNVLAGDVSTATNWTTSKLTGAGYGPGTATAGGGWSGGTWTAIAGTTQTNAVSLFNQPLDMTQSLTLSGKITTSTNISVASALGVMLLPTGTPLSLNAGGTGTGILPTEGTANAIFAGRDIYPLASTETINGQTVANNDWTGGSYWQIRISQTGANGLKQASASTNNTANPVVGTGTYNGTSGESYVLTWTPTTGTTGSLSYALTTGGSTYTVTWPNLTLPASMQVGLAASAGGWTSTMTYTNTTLTASRVTAPVPVNYLNKVTGQAIPSMGPSTITANLGDIVGLSLVSPTTSNPDSNSYTFLAPAAPAGYNANSSTNTVISATNPASSTNTAATKVQSVAQGATNPNILNVTYTPSQQTVAFSWALASGTNLAALPASKSYGAAGTGVTTDTSVVTDNPFASTTLLKNYASDLTAAVPAGYNITSITNGTSTYTGATTAATLATFTAANPTVSATQANNNYTVTLTAAAQTAIFNYGYVNTAQNTPAVPSSMTTTGGTTGANVAAPTGWNTPSTATAANKIPFGYYISAIYAGNSATGTPIATGTGTTGTGANAAFPATGQTYGATGNQYYVQLSPYSVRTSWHISVLGTDPDYLDTLGGQYAGYVGGQATPNAQTFMMNDVNNSTPLTTTDNIVYTDGAGIRYIITGYTYSLTSNSAAGTTYPTFTALLAANPYMPVGTYNAPTQYVMVNMISDQTSITSNLTSSTTPLTPATNYMPINDITASTDIDGVDDDGLPYAINGYNAVTNIVGATTNYWGDATNSLKLPIGSYTETFYALNYLGLQAYQAQSTYTTVASFLQSLSSANLAKYTVSSTTTLTVADATTISANNQHIIPKAGSYNPSSDVLSATNADGTNAFAAVNNVPVGVIITDSTGNTVWVNNMTVNLPKNKLVVGTYSEKYYALTAQGAADYTTWKATASPSANTVGDFINSGQATTNDYVTATTQLTVTNFILPFAGGSGNQFLYLMISLAAIGALGLYFSKRRKEEEFEFVPEQVGYGASTNTNGNKARFFQTLRKTRPYRKVFHSKNRIHLAQMQRKEGKND